MASGYEDWLEPEPFLDQRSEPPDGKVAIVAAREEVGGYRRPARKGPRLVEQRSGLVATFRDGCQDFGVHVVGEERLGRPVDEVLGVERVGVTGVHPPLVTGLTRGGDHRGDEDDRRDGVPIGDEWGNDSSERLSDQDEVSSGIVDLRCNDDIADGVHIGVESDVVVAGQVDCEDAVASGVQDGSDTPPVRTMASRAMDAHEGGHGR